MCKPNTFGLREDNVDGCGPCDCYWFGIVPNKACGILEGKCPCIDGAGDPAKTNYSCVSNITYSTLILLCIFHNQMEAVHNEMCT